MNSPTDPLDVLTKIRPAAVASEPLARIHTTIEEAIRADDAGERRAVSSPGAHVRRRTRPAILVGAAAAVAAGILLIAPVLRSSPAVAATPPMLTYSASSADSVVTGSAPSGTAIAEQLASTAAAQTATEPMGEVSLVESAYWSLEAVHEDEQSTQLVVLPVERQIWSSTVDGSMRFREVRGTPLSQDGSTTLPDVEFSGQALLDYELPGDHDRGVLQPDDLPRDPEALLEAVSHARGPHTCDLSLPAARIDCLADALGMMVQASPLPTDLVATFWNALAQEAQLYTLGETTDRFGRDGVTLAYAAPETGTVEILIADPTTGALLGTEGVDVTGTVTGADSPAVFSLEAFQPARWVDGFDAS